MIVPQEQRSVNTSDFARAIAAREDCVREITADNRAVEVPWPSEWRRPFAVYVADPTGYRCLVGDFDGDGAPRDAEQFRDLLNVVGIRSVMTSSGGDGNRHVLATFDRRLPAAEVAGLGSRLRERFSSADIGVLRNPTTGCIRPPGALHRRGGFSIVLGDPVAALNALETPNDSKTFGDLCDLLVVERGGLSGDMRKVLRAGNLRRRYKSRSEMAQGLALAYVNAELPEEEFLRDMLDERNRGGERVQQENARNGPRGAARYVHRMWITAIEFKLKSPPIRGRVDVDERLDRAGGWLDTRTWKGVGGATDRQVFAAHLAKARSLGKIAPCYSVREAAEDAACSIGAISASRERLVRRGCLKRVESDRPDYAHAWEILVPNLNTHPYTPPIDKHVQGPVSDLWRSQGLGKTKHRVWSLLSERGEDLKELAEMMGVKPRTVRDHLRVLERHGLAEERHGEWFRGSASEDEVAEALNVAGLGLKAKARHGTERAEFHRLGGGAGK